MIPDGISVIWFPPFSVRVCSCSRCRPASARKPSYKGFYAFVFSRVRMTISAISITDPRWTENPNAMRARTSYICLIEVSFSLGCLLLFDLCRLSTSLKKTSKTLSCVRTTIEGEEWTTRLRQATHLSSHGMEEPFTLLQ